MRGADHKAQRLGVTGERLMEEAGVAVAAAIRALLVTTERTGHGPVLVLAGPGNNGGDGNVAARYLAAAGVRVVCVLVASEDRAHDRRCAPRVGAPRWHDRRSGSTPPTSATFASCWRASRRQP